MHISHHLALENIECANKLTLKVYTLRKISIGFFSTLHIKIEAARKLFGYLNNMFVLYFITIKNLIYFSVILLGRLRNTIGNQRPLPVLSSPKRRGVGKWQYGWLYAEWFHGVYSWQSKQRPRILAVTWIPVMTDVVAVSFVSVVGLDRN